jgi:malate dehydrogenase (oxaloacetate-decarboxylating)
MDVMKESISKHYEWAGKIEVVSRIPITDKQSLSLAYTPGVAGSCLEIQKHPELSYKLTRRGNLVAVITDGSAVLGLGDIGPLAAMPVMEGKCALFKEFADVDAFPVCIASASTDEIVRTVQLISGSFGGINLEDISAPRCFEIEKRLSEILDIPVFHDDQHGTAIVAGAALLNACKILDKPMKELTFAMSGAGAAGIAVAKHFLALGAGDIIMCNRSGIIHRDTDYANAALTEIAGLTNKSNRKGSLRDALKGADVFVGVSGPGLVDADMVRSMADRPVVFAMANPVPEIMPDIAKAAGAYIVGTGRSDFPNQINNVLAFPGIFKGVLQSGAAAITEEMKLAATYAIAGQVPAEKLSPDFIIPDPFDKSVPLAIAKAISAVAVK